MIKIKRVMESHFESGKKPLLDIENNLRYYPSYIKNKSMAF
jgi:hypothetical protein